jgi:hypothetical protein
LRLKHKHSGYSMRIEEIIVTWFSSESRLLFLVDG